MSATPKPAPSGIQITVDGTPVTAADIIVCPVTGVVLLRRNAESVPAGIATGPTPPRPAVSVVPRIQESYTLR